VPVGVTGHRTKRPRGQVGPPGPHPAHSSSSLDPGDERWPISPPLAPLIAQLVRGVRVRSCSSWAGAQRLPATRRGCGTSYFAQKQQIRNKIIAGRWYWLVPQPPKPEFPRLNTHNGATHRSKCLARTAAPVAGAGQCTGCIWATAGPLHATAGSQEEPTRRPGRVTYPGSENHLPWLSVITLTGAICNSRSYFINISQSHLSVSRSYFMEWAPSRRVGAASKGQLGN
jgi:hypothetical protein